MVGTLFTYYNLQNNLTGNLISSPIMELEYPLFISLFLLIGGIFIT